jgi:hypothetical protein
MLREVEIVDDKTLPLQIALPVDDAPADDAPA